MSAVDPSAAMLSASRLQPSYHRVVARMPVADYLAMKSATVEGTLLRRMLTAERRDRFTHEVMEAFRTWFGEVVEFTRDFLIGLGTKP